MSTEAKVATQYLEQMRLDVEQGFDGIEKNLADVRRHTDQLLRDVKFPEAVATTFGVVESALSAMIEATQAFCAGSVDPGEAGGLLGELRSSYTMERERTLHDGVVGGLVPRESEPWATDGPADSEGPRATSDEEDLGENVELF